jgi:FAD/FMN-containing dehydrogenase
MMPRSIDLGSAADTLHRSAIQHLRHVCATEKNMSEQAPKQTKAADIAAVLGAISAIVGDRGMLTEASDTAAYTEDWRRLYRGSTPAVIRPANTTELASVVAICAADGVVLVPQGGNTSMVGGATPSASGTELVLSLSRMNRIRAIDPIDMTITLEAGVTLKAAQNAAADAGCLLPLSISSEGTAQIGGVLATNAGGNNTLRYGNARDLVLGLEVVLPDGQIWNGLRRLRKDNTGYCLRQLFVGSEGTLGVITAAVLKLAPRAAETEVALCAVATAEAALELYTRFNRHDPAAIQAFEYMSGAGMDFVLRHIPNTSLPFRPAPHYALIELATPRAGAGLRDIMEEVLAAAMEAEIVTEAVMAESEAQRGNLWRLREEHAEAQKREGASVKNDVSVPVSKVPELLARAADASARLMPGIRMVPFGHMGDGNIHLNFEQPVDMDAAEFLAQDHAIMDMVGEIVRSLDGSFSAEHGVGQLKPYMMPDWRGGAELDMMRRIKNALDPLGLMNPGKVLPPG